MITARGFDFQLLTMQVNAISLALVMNRVPEPVKAFWWIHYGMLLCSLSFPYPPFFNENRKV
jgi:hypothetical protein